MVLGSVDFHTNQHTSHLGFAETLTLCMIPLCHCQFLARNLPLVALGPRHWLVGFLWGVVRVNVVGGRHVIKTYNNFESFEKLR